MPKSTFQPGDWVSWTYRDNGALRTLTGVVLFAHELITIRSGGGQPRMRRGKHIHLLPSELKHINALTTRGVV